MKIKQYEKRNPSRELDKKEKSALLFRRIRVRQNETKSLILAQDERWRRA